MIWAGTLLFKTLPFGKAAWALLPDAHLLGRGLPCLLLPKLQHPGYCFALSYVRSLRVALAEMERRLFAVGRLLVDQKWPWRGGFRSSW